MSILTRDQLSVENGDFEEEYLEAEIGKIKTNKLVRRAKKFGIDLSAQQGWWTDDQQEYPTSFLNDSGLTQAKLLIQDRFRQSREMAVLDTYCPRRTSGWCLFVLQLQLASTAPSCPPGGRTVRPDVSYHPRHERIT